ncbi:MAG: 1-deoxy-D-xylulose-5-phosphate synthase [Bacteroidia bacterium]|nr:1-deoxy-D-xylulose-5-phosphate synthase [Bacteroidia bacterium]
MAGLLEKINDPSDLRKLSEDDLAPLCEELRRFIIEAVSCNPAHFAASLGVVELTVALHYVFNTPYDQLIWDVGHQAYSHKILTGRKDIFYTNRKLNGISGFPRMEESIYDAFGTGHASTSISAALGIALGSRFNKENDRQVIAVIGDGSMTGGMAFEGLNNAGINNTNLLVILNDNNIAIDPSVGALKDYLLDITTSHTYNRMKEDVWNLLGRLSKIGPDARKLVQKLEGGLKSVLLKQSNLFESMKFRYFGPVDGHDVVFLTKVLNDLKEINGPKLLHVLTKKGKGFVPAELDQTRWHATSSEFDIRTGEPVVKDTTAKPPRYQDVFGHTVVELAEMNPKIVGITPAMPSGSSLNIMMNKMPDRAFDVGIAEQHAVTFAAGLATQGMIPFCIIYSTFLQRGYDQLIHDVAIQNLQVVFCLDRAGLVGADGVTHHGTFDMAYLRCIPNLIISSPMNEEEMRNLMFTAQLHNNGPFAIRYPRGNGTMTNWRLPFKEIKIGTGRTMKDGKDLAILSIGPLGNRALRVCEKLEKEGISAAHYDMRFLKPLDENLLHDIFRKFSKIITLEDGAITGGFGSAVLEFMNSHDYHATVKRLGVPDKFIEHGTQIELHMLCGYDTDGILEAARKLVS